MKYSHNIFNLMDGNNNDSIVAGFTSEAVMLEYIRTELLSHIRPENIILDRKIKYVCIKHKKDGREFNEQTQYSFDIVNYYIE